MAKYIKRIGTKAEKYAVQIDLEKVEMKLATAARVSVSFTRGPHKAETSNAPNLEDGFAEFDESLVLPVTFYHDIKKEKYLQKQGVLSVSIITKRGSKSAGKTKFDLAEYLNNDTKEKHEVIPILKCLDKAAKFHFTIKLISFDELENELAGDVDSEEEEESISKVHQTEEHHDNLSHLEKRKNMAGSRLEINKDKGSKDFINNWNTKTQSPIPRRKNTGRNAANMLADSSDSESDNGLKPGKSAVEKMYEELKRKYDGAREELNALKLQNERLKKTFDKGKVENKKDKYSTVSTLDPDVESYKDKIDELEHEIAQLKANSKSKEPQTEIEKRNQELEKQFKEIEQELKKYQNAAAAFEKEFPSSTNTEIDVVSFAKYKNVSKELMLLKEDNAILKAKNEELEGSILKLEITIQEKETRISELELKLRKKDREIAETRSSFMSRLNESRDEANLLAKIAELERRNTLLETILQNKTVKSQKDKEELKEEVERMSLVKQLEEELVKLSTENENLKNQLNEMRNKPSSSKSNKKHGKDSHKRIQELENAVKAREDELAKAKMEWASDIEEKEKMSRELADCKFEMEKLRIEMRKLSESLLTARTNLGAVMNTVFEYGGPELFDRIEEKVSFGEPEYMSKLEH